MRGMPTSKRSEKYLVWIDCEMTGLDTSVDELVEIAVVVVVRPRVRLAAGDAKQLRLNELESRAGGTRGDNGGDSRGDDGHRDCRGHG